MTIATLTDALRTGWHRNPERIWRGTRGRSAHHRGKHPAEARLIGVLEANQQAPGQGIKRQRPRGEVDLRRKLFELAPAALTYPAVIPAATGAARWQHKRKQIETQLANEG